jgi:methyltransferase (TIGR00027 family)
MRSLVAGVNALFRANESRRPEGQRLLLDTFAGVLAERDPRVLAIRYARVASADLRRIVDELQTAHCVRHRAIDELLLDAVAAGGFRQIVSVGAGYDMRPLRFETELEGVRCVEIDHPDTLARKERLLAAHLGRLRSVERVAIDLLADSLDDALRRTSIDRAQPICFVLEGLIHYLTPERLDALLESIAKASSSDRVVVILSFIRSEVYRSAPSSFIRLVRILREVPRLHFSVAELRELAARHGLKAFSSWTIEEQIERFAQNARGRPIGVSQDVARLERLRRGGEDG